MVINTSRELLKLLVFKTNFMHTNGHADAQWGHPLRGKTNMLPKQCAAPGGRAAATRTRFYITGASF